MIKVTFTSTEKTRTLKAMANSGQKIGASLFAAFLVMAVPAAHAAGVSGGLTLIESPNARPAALGEAFSAASDDISAVAYNPASLKSLKMGQASFLYQKGIAEDAYGHFMVGVPTKKGSLGMSVGYYNGGSIDLYDGANTRTVNAQTDLSVGLSYSNNVGPVAVGVTGKYLSSQLIESARATAFAGDFGLSMPVNSRVQIGGAVQNIGTQLKFVEEGDSLPRIARTGVAISLLSNRSTTLLMDAIYHMNEQELTPAAGLEVSFGLLAVRAGYKGGRGAQEFSIGTGLMIGRSNLDYSFGMMDGLEARHRVSLSMRFSGPAAPSPFVRAIESTPKTTLAHRVVEVEENEAMGKSAPVRHSLGSLDAKKPSPVRRASRVYVVRTGDTLGRIAAKYYGTKTQAARIFAANKHLMENPNDLTAGQKIILPE
jgi:phage tail protein X